MREWQKKQARARRAPVKRIGLTQIFTIDDVLAVAHAMHIDEPSTVQLRRFMTGAIQRAIKDARARYEEAKSVEEADIPFSTQP